MRACALTIDLDGPNEYARLHGVDARRCDPLAMYAGPLQRFMELCNTLGMHPTIFAIGRDVDRGGCDVLRLCASAGAELAAHSYAHDYALSLRDVPYVFEDVARVASAFERAFGRRPAGFRAPGYLMSRTLHDAIIAAGFSYDSSSLPSPSYYAVKAAVVTAYKLLGRRPVSPYGSFRATLSRRTPHRSSGLPELPISVATPARLPLTATALILAPPPLRSAMLRSTPDVVVVNAHAMDFVDAAHDGLPLELIARQPELRIPLSVRLETFRKSMQQLLVHRAAKTCEQIAQAI